MGIATTPMTFAEFERLPDGPEQLELLEGDLVRMPPPEREHMRIVEGLFRLLHAALEQWRQVKPAAEVGLVHVEMGYLLTSEPRSWLRPDVSVTHPNQPGHKYYEGAPLLVLEVVSAEDQAAKLNRKVRQFLLHGAQEVWLIYPETRDAYVYQPGMAAAVHEEKAVRSRLLPGIEIPFDQFL